MSSFGIFLEYLFIFLAIYVVLYLIYLIIKCIINSVASKALISTINEKRKARSALLQSINLPPVNLPIDFVQKILNSDVTNLKVLLDQGQVTSEQLVLIFSSRALTVGLDYELITDVNFEAALQMARECDRIRATKYGGAPLKDREGVLFGIPISIKDLFEMKGFDMNYGCGALCQQPITRDGYVIRLLIQQGAIPFVRSNVPQVGFALECWNKVYGKGQNPWNKSRTPGGSSGGEAGLVAARCSPLGLGSDMGGSIRAPANFCGIFGFKPGSRRVSIKGNGFLTKAFDGLTNIIPISIGPMAKSSDDVVLLMKALLDERFHLENRYSIDGDHYYVPTPWNDQIFLNKRPYRIGYLRNNTFMPVASSWTRAIDETVDALKVYGHDLVEIEMNFLDVVQSLFYQALTADGDLGVFKDAVKEQGLDNELFKNLKMIIGLPNWLKGCLGWLTGKTNMPRVSGLMKSTCSKSAHELLELISSIRSFNQKFMEWWNAYHLDVLIIPNIGMPAFKHGLGGDISVFGTYTMLANLLDIPAGAVPITLVGEDETEYDELVASNRDMITKKAKENMIDSQGMPVGVQVITPFNEEERCVAIMKQIEEQVRFYERYSFPI